MSPVPMAIPVRTCVLLAVLAGAAAGLTACGPGDEEPPWQIVEHELPGSLLSVWGTSSSDIYVVGGDANQGDGPEVRHFDGTSWTRLMTGEAGDLWWVHGFAGGPVYMGGSGGMILRYEGGTFTRMSTPGTETIFGIWGASAGDVWAVGGQEGGAHGAFAWRLQGGDTWMAEPTFPATLTADTAMWKIYGRAA